MCEGLWFESKVSLKWEKQIINQAHHQTDADAFNHSAQLRSSCDNDKVKNTDLVALLSAVNALAEMSACWSLAAPRHTGPCGLSDSSAVVGRCRFHVHTALNCVTNIVFLTHSVSPAVG